MAFYPDFSASCQDPCAQLLAQKDLEAGAVNFIVLCVFAAPMALCFLPFVIPLECGLMISCLDGRLPAFLRALHVPGFDAVAQSSSPASGELRNTSNGVAQPPLSAHPLAPFAMTVVCRTDLKEGAGCCAICLDDVRARTTVMLNCCHRFHRDCLTNWPRTACSARYPLCNKPVARVEVGG